MCLRFVILLQYVCNDVELEIHSFVMNFNCGGGSRRGRELLSGCCVVDTGSGLGIAQRSKVPNG